MQDKIPPPKRTLTEQARESIVASNHSPSSSLPDMSARLRSVAARVRKNVTEGYVTSPSFSKSFSTGDIFYSANDTLRSIFPPAPSGTTETPQVSHKKRARPLSDQGHNSDQGIPEDDEDGEMALYEERRVDASTLSPNTTPFGRPMKPLRRTSRKGVMITRSLPAGSMRNLESSSSHDATMGEEEDWSVPDAFQMSSGHTTSFEPMILS